jgi:hypothetical protein
MAVIRVLSPVGVASGDRFVVPALPLDLAGRSVGFVDNTKPNFDQLVDELAGLLRQRHGVAAIVHKKKSNCSTPAPAELLAELAKTCDLVFAGSGD